MAIGHPPLSACESVQSWVIPLSLASPGALHITFTHKMGATIPALTKRELEVLQLTWEGLDAEEIAERLSIHRKTVDYHRSNIRQKLDAENMISAIRRALRAGLLQP